MIIQGIYDINNFNKQLNAIDLEKAALYNHLLILDGKLPSEKTVNKLVGNAPVNYVLHVHKNNLEELMPFDLLTAGEHQLEVCKLASLGNNIAVLCKFDTPFPVQEFDSLNVARKIFKIKIITLSTRAFHGIYPDKSGPAIKEKIDQYLSQQPVNYEIELVLIPDNKHKLAEILENSKKQKDDIVITTGGTGIGKSDFTIDVVEGLLDKQIPGLMEMIRVKYGADKPSALLSRSVAGVMDDSLVYALPGSVKAVNEYLTEILKSLMHQLYMLHGIDIH
jgi:molybdenum cofactor synthesis domain-containing protein